MAADTHMEEEHIEDTAAAAGEFVPPSIDEAALLSGASYSHFSPVPASLLQASSDSSDRPPCVLGVDEAGRGPVLGPMVYGVFYAPLAAADALLRGDSDAAAAAADMDVDRDPASGAPLRFDDSKVLSASMRATLLATVCRAGSTLHRTCGWAVELLSARDIGANMMAPVGSAAGSNLNAQALTSTVSLIRGVLDRGVHVTEVYVDTVGPPLAYQHKLERFFPGLRITVSKKADSIYPSVSAASVCAKVTRDVALDVLYRRYKGANAEGGKTATPDWGSGYPSDGRCTAWLRSNMHPLFGWGPECRFSWGTAKDMLEDSKKNGGVKVEWPVPEEAADGDDNDGFSVTRMTDFYAASAARRAGEGGGGGDDVVDELGSWFGQPAGIETF